MRTTIIGVDVGGTSIKFGKFDLGGQLLTKWSIRTDKTERGEHILEDIVSSIKNHAPIKTIKGIGIGLPGPVTENIVLHCVNLGWGRKDVETEMRPLLADEEIIIKAANDATVAAAGEMYQGIAKGYRNVVMYTLGTGVGGGIIIDGRIVEGMNGVAGELGHTIVDFRHNYLCACGKRGCLETVASATGIIQLAKEKMIKSKVKSPLRRMKTFSAKKVFDLAKEGDHIALKTIEEAMQFLALSMANTTLTLNPEIIVIGGGVSHAGPMIIDMIEKYYYDMTEPFISHTHFALATLGNEAGIYGCCYLVK